MKILPQYPHPGVSAAGVMLAWGMVTLPFSSAAQVSNAPEASDLDRVVVTGIRGSLQSSMNLKRDSSGVVDGIIAEDIGKFPDTNLAESLQRISGVSIDRTASGEGSRVTVRGIGPDFNLVLLNGRQMPAANLGPDGNGVSNSRAFDFANLASESVSELEVHKTVRADMPTGGIGATLNIKTLRPLDHPGLHAQIGIKGVMDRSVDNLPGNFSGRSMTPEVSGMFSNTSGDGRFGVAVSASWQERDSGFSQISNDRGWYTFRGDDDSSLFHLPQSYEPAWSQYDITNQPQGTDIYGRPLSLRMSVTGVHRERRNGQVVLQFAPADNLTTTLDYTWAQNTIEQQVAMMSVTFGFLPGVSSWTDGPVAGPIIYSESPSSDAGLSIRAGFPASRNELKSLGFNVEWQPTDTLDLTLDWHNSKAHALPYGQYGTDGFLGTASNVRRTTTVDFSRDFPVLNLELAPGIVQLGPEHAMLGSSVFQGSYNWSEVKQWNAGGTFRFADYQALDFGASRTEVHNRSAASRSLLTAGNGYLTPGDYDDDLFQVDNMGRYFSRFSGHNDPRFSDRFLLIDFDGLRQRAIELGVAESLLRLSDNFFQELQARETSDSGWLRWRNTFDWKVPVNIGAGVRYEKTRISSPSSVSPPVGNVRWPTAAPEFNVLLDNERVVENYDGEYNYWLPHLDVRMDLLENLVLRGSYGKSIGRAGWRDIQGGLSVNNQLRAQEGTGALGNPGLLPLESKNFDLSLEWYYGAGSYVSLGYFRKNITNFISNTIIRDSPYDVHTPVGGTYWNNALAAGCLDGDLTCIWDYIFANHAGSPGVEQTGFDANGRATGMITGLDTDPLAEFNLTSPANQRSDHLDGWELNLQHMFGNSGFGMSVNYTKVDSGLTFDNTRLGDQYPMVGLSDSANLVVFYDRHDWQVRVAYNWRDEFLSRGSDGTGPNPWYTESYGQLDANVTWAVNDRLSLFVEGINLTDETQRIHSRHRNMLLFATQTGPRYMFGARYKF